MGYCTQAQVSNYVSPARLVQLADHDEDGSADAAVIAQAIGHATGTIDSYLQVKFVVPLTAPYPEEIKRICMVLTVCELQTGLDSLTEDHKDVCDQALDELQKIADGSKSVGLTPLPTESASAPRVRHTAQDRAFGRDFPL